MFSRFKFKSGSIINRLLFRLGIFTALILLIKPAIGQDVQFTAEAPRAVETGEQFRLQYSVNAKPSSFNDPEIKDFSVLTGPNVSSSSSVQIMNGSMTQSSSYTYTYILVGNTAGKFTIPSASVKVGGKVYQSNAITIEVVKGSAGAASSQQQQDGGSSTVDKANVSDDNLFVSINVDKKNLYQGQYLAATIKLYSKVDISGLDEIKFPPFTGFWSQDLEAPSQISLQRENVNGQIYNTALIKKVLLMPQRSGDLVIDPFEITILIRKRVKSNSPFDDFFGGSFRTVQKKLTSQPVHINVQALPEGKPSGFSGGVGSFQMNASVDKQSVKTNEAVTLKVRVGGTGNLKFVNPLKVDFPPDIDVYDPKTTQNIKTDVSGMSGSVQFDYLFIPRYAGNFRIPPITFSYFDTGSKTYRTITSSEFNISVAKGEGEAEGSASGVVQSLTKEDVKFIGKDIRFIKPNVPLERKQTFIFGTPLFWLGYLVPLFAFVAIILFRYAQIKQNANLAAVKNRKANKVSKKRLRQASVFMKQGQNEKFYDEILKAIWGYLSDKLSIPLASLSKDNVTGILEKHQVDPQLLSELIDLLNACEFAKYAPSAVSGGMEEIFKKADTLISVLDQKVK
jgi:hypothetical protein